MSVNQNNAKVVATCNQRLVALNKLVAAKAVMKINGQPMKLADVIALYQACLDTRAALVTQRAAFEKALSARDGRMNDARDPRDARAARQLDESRAVTTVRHACDGRSTPVSTWSGCSRSANSAR